MQDNAVVDKNKLIRTVSTLKKLSLIKFWSGISLCICFFVVLILVITENESILLQGAPSVVLGFLLLASMITVFISHFALIVKIRHAYTQMGKSKKDIVYAQAGTWFLMGAFASTSVKDIIKEAEKRIKESGVN